MATVSVVTPTYNRARFLPDAVSSVLAQTYADLELIIVDDGSVDQTRKVLEPFFSDKRVRYFFQENQGQSHARNLALEKAKGDFIAFLDSDDLWARDKIDKQLAVLQENPSVDIVHGDEATIDQQGAIISLDNMKRYSGRITRYLLVDNSVSITTALVRRSCFDEMGGFNTSVGVADDYELWLRFSSRYLFHYEPGIVASYRVMADQISSDKRRRFAANELIIREFLAKYGGVLSLNERRRGLAGFLCRKARYFAFIGDRGAAVSAIARAVQLTPWSPIVWRSLYRVFRPKRSA